MALLTSRQQSTAERVAQAITRIIQHSFPCVLILWVLCGDPLLSHAEEKVVSLNALAQWHLGDPLWSSSTVHGESILCLQETEDTRPVGRLLFPVIGTLKVTRANQTEEFVEGLDYVVDRVRGRIELPQHSRIPFLQASSLFPPKDAVRSLAHRAGDLEQGVLFDNQHWFHDQQIEVTYKRASEWTGYRPVSALQNLPKTASKLQKGDPLTLAVSGDSISFGLNASGLTGAPPLMPTYPSLVAEHLRHTTKSQITLVNRAVSGWRIEQGIADCPQLLESKPDLVIVAYGMNHIGARDPEGFRTLLQSLLRSIVESETRPEVILLSPMIGNDQWVHTPRDQFRPHRDAIAGLAGPGIAFADLTSMWENLLERKNNCDLTGNGVNHPNDFGHRIHAQVVLGLLDPAKTQSLPR